MQDALLNNWDALLDASYVVPTMESCAEYPPPSTEQDKTNGIVVLTNGCQSAICILSTYNIPLETPSIVFPGVGILCNDFSTSVHVTSSASYLQHVLA